MTFANQVKQTLLQDISVMTKTTELFSKCPGKNFLEIVRSTFNL